MGYYAHIDNKKPANRFLNGVSNNLLILGATFAGVVFGVVLSVAMMRPMVHSELAAATKSLHSQNQAQQTLAMKPASLSQQYLACAAPSGQASSGHLLGAEAVKQSSESPVTLPHKTHTNPSNNGNGGGGGGTTVVKKIIGGFYAKTNAKITDTGYDSTNIISTKNTQVTKVDNDNDVTLTNNNPQSATSGDVTSSQNTTAGQATSGDASNSSKTTFNVSINNGAEATN